MTEMLEAMWRPVREVHHVILSDTGVRGWNDSPDRMTPQSFHPREEMTPPGIEWLPSWASRFMQQNSMHFNGCVAVTISYDVKKISWSTSERIIISYHCVMAFWLICCHGYYMVSQLSHHIYCSLKLNFVLAVRQWLYHIIGNGDNHNIMQPIRPTMIKGVSKTEVENHCIASLNGIIFMLWQIARIKVSCSWASTALYLQRRGYSLSWHRHWKALILNLFHHSQIHRNHSLLLLNFESWL